MATATAARLQPSPPTACLVTVSVSGAGHHVPLEEPRELASIISATAAEWTVQTPPDNRRIDESLPHQPR
jgi:hypothetical protein